MVTRQRSKHVLDTVCVVVAKLRILNPAVRQQRWRDLATDTCKKDPMACEGCETHLSEEWGTRMSSYAYTFWCPPRIPVDVSPPCIRDGRPPSVDGVQVSKRPPSVRGSAHVKKDIGVLSHVAGVAGQPMEGWQAVQNKLQVMKGP